MKIQSLEAIPLNIAFRKMFKFGMTDRKKSQNVVLRVTTDEGQVGYGEACPVPAFTGETQESISAIVRDRVDPLVVGRDPLDYEPILAAAAGRLFGCPFTLSALDIALRDLAGKLLDVPISTLLGGAFRRRIEVHGSVGWDEPSAMATVAREQAEAGFATLKLYAGRGTLEADLERIRTVRSAVGEKVPFILDVNGMWDVGTALRALPRLRELGVTLLEQPVAPWDDEGQVEVVRRAEVDIAADEAIRGVHDAARIARLRTAHVLNLGLAKLGGLLASRECATVARASGLKVMVGSVLELGIATAAGLHLAASLPELAYPSYLVGPMKYECEITETIAIRGGVIDVPTGPGLGVAVDEAMLRELDARR